MQLYLNKNTSNCLKVLSAVIVMLHHYSQYALANNVSDALFYHALSTQGGYLGVAIFFFLSGYGLMQSESRSHLDALSFIKRRLLKVYLPVIAVTVIWVVVSPLLLSQSSFNIGLGGGNLHNISILWCFGDAVLWFVRVLIPLYILFFIFSLIYTKNTTIGLTFIWLTTIVLTIYVVEQQAAFKAISIVYFSLGVQVSLIKITNFRRFLIPIGILVLLSVISIFYLDRNLALHSIFNAISIAIMLLILSIRRFDLKIPSILALLSFDLYLVHNKVLISMQSNMDCVDIWLFITLTLLATIGFHFFRTKILRI